VTVDEERRAARPKGAGADLRQRRQARKGGA
jgi:hypothetical protein